MEQYRKHIAYGGAVFCAPGVGFLMQNGRDAPRLAAVACTVPAAESERVRFD